ncbi:MAG: VF530 family DNA-binding protein [Marinicellaceae bacterium]
MNNFNNHKDPLHGVTLKAIVTELHTKYGWEKLGQLIKIKCFNNQPSINSSLKFLRKTPWARTEVEQLYIRSKNTNDNFDWNDKGSN